MSILVLYVKWHFLIAPLAILSGWRNILIFNLSYFSIPLLLKTLISPWRRSLVSYAKGFHIAKFFESLASNLISRIIGFVIRTFVISVGIAAELALVLVGPIVVAFWISLPVLIIFTFIYGFKLLI